MTWPGQEVGIRDVSLGYTVVCNFSGHKREKIDSRCSSLVE